MIKFEKVSTCPGAIIPKRATQGSAGYDFYMYSEDNVKIAPGEMQAIQTGIKAKFPSGIVLKVYIRSSLTKRGLVLGNSVGIVDSDYYNNPSNEGNILVLIRNVGKVPAIIEVGERIAQGLF